MAGKVTAGLLVLESNGAYHRVYGYVTCGLTAKKPGSAPRQTLVIEYGNILFISRILAKYDAVFTFACDVLLLLANQCDDSPLLRYFGIYLLCIF